jgi:hypothetical protein
VLTVTLVTGIAFGVLAQQGDSKKAPGPESSGPTAERWVPLFNGRDLTGWYTFLQKHGKNQDPDRVITIEDGSIHLYKDAPHGSNVVMGYISTEKEYGDYHLRLQYRWGAKKFQPRLAMERDAGLYYHILGADAVWPRSLQFQIEQTNVGDLIALHGLELDTWIDPKTRSAKKPTFQESNQGGEPFVLGGRRDGYHGHLAGAFERDGWNTAEIIVRGTSTTHILNGQVVNRGKNVRLVDREHPGSARPITRGRIALELEAAEIYFRKVEIRLLDEQPVRGE